MNKLKKLLGIVIISAFCLGINLTVSAESTVISSSDISVSDDMVTISVAIKNNTGIAAGKILMEYDENVLEPVEAIKSTVLSEVMYFTSSTDDENSDISDLGGNMTVSWVNASDLKGDGDLYTCTFRMKEQTNTTINLSAENSIVNMNGKNVVCLCESIDITSQASDDTTNTTGDIEVSFGSSSLKSVNSTVSGDVTAVIYNGESDNIKSNIFIAVYDSNMTLIAVQLKEVQLKSGLNEITFNNLSANVSVLGECSAKLILWSSIDDMEPLADSKLIKIR